MRPNSEIRDVIDELGTLNEELKADKRIKRQKELKDSLKKYIDSHASFKNAEKEDTLTTDNFLVEVSKNSLKRFIKNMELVRTVLGHDVFMKIADVKLGDLDKYLTPDELNACVQFSRDKGTRTTKFSRMPVEASA